MSDAREGDNEVARQGEPSAMKLWFGRFTDPIVIVALITAAASTSFAYQTNRISQRQMELLDRQVAIEESLALPVFTVTMDIANVPDADSHWISIDNSGGLANGLSIDILPYLSFWWIEDDDTGEPVMMQGDELPIVGYFNEYSHVLPAHMPPGMETALGFDGNAAALREVTEQLNGQLSAQDGITELDYALEIMVSLSYIDYTGTERADYYIAHVDSTGEVFPPQQFIRINATVGEEVWEDYYGKFDSQFILVLDPETEPPGVDEVQALGGRIYDQRYTELEELATPVARVPSEYRSRLMRQDTIAGS